MTIVETHAFLDDMLQKTQTGFVSPITKDRALERGQMSVFATYYAQFVETGYIHDALNPFRTKFDWFTEGQGLINCPADYLFPTSVYGISWDNAQKIKVYPEIKVIKEDELGPALNSQLRKVDVNNPIVYQSGKLTLNAYPEDTLFTGRSHYLRKPLTPKYNYTLPPGARQPIYSPSGSQDLEWSDVYVNPVLMKALEFLGINLSAPAVTQWAAQKTAQNIGEVKA